MIVPIYLDVSLKDLPKMIFSLILLINLVNIVDVWEANIRTLIESSCPLKIYVSY